MAPTPVEVDADSQLGCWRLRQVRRGSRSQLGNCFSRSHNAAQLIQIAFFCRRRRSGDRFAARRLLWRTHRRDACATERTLRQTGRMPVLLRRLRCCRCVLEAGCRAGLFGLVSLDYPRLPCLKRGVCLEMLTGLLPYPYKSKACAVLARSRSAFSAEKSRRFRIGGPRRVRAHAGR